MRILQRCKKIDVIKIINFNLLLYLSFFSRIKCAGWVGERIEKDEKDCREKKEIEIK